MADLLLSLRESRVHQDKFGDSASWRFSRGGHGHPWLLSVMAVLDPVRPHSLQCKRKAEPANLGVPKQSFGTFVLPFPI